MGTFTEEEIADKFPDEHLMILKTELNEDELWYGDYVNYIVGKIVPPNWTPEIFLSSKIYFWDEPYAFKLCPDNIMRRCVSRDKIHEILAHCHSGPTGGHHSASITRRKVYEVGLFWPSIFKDAKDYRTKTPGSTWKELRDGMTLGFVGIRTSKWETSLPVVWIDSVNYVKKYNKCLELEAELIKQHNMVEKDEYNKLSKSFSKLEQHCISLELAMQLNKEIFQKNNTSVNQIEPTFDHLFELNNLKAELQAKDKTIEKLKANIKCLNKTSTTNSVKKDIDEIETINIELEHRVAKLIAENEHLKQTYKQLYDSIKPSRVRAKEHVESLVNQLNLKSIEITDFKSSTLGKGFCHNNIKNDLRKLKGKDIVDNATQVSNATTIAPGMYKLDPVTLVATDKNYRETHIYYLKHTMEQVAILREVVEQAKSLNPLDSASYYACKYVKLIQELLGYVRDTCPDIHKPSEKLVAVTPINKKKILDGLRNLAGQVLQTITRMMDPADFKHSKLNTNYELMCVKCNSSMFDARHELCFLKFVSDMNAYSKSKSVKKAKKKEE
ncbi:hypothetical protein Tco_0629483 [Tanacetum coccineum]|uniref:Reverse transcriptase domain-containing protein n=1 Tax=Tanacetum coccineum TaxID=301880 RepID=A0ABQ4WTB7_9ASTR